MSQKQNVINIQGFLLILTFFFTAERMVVLMSGKFMVEFSIKATPNQVWAKNMIEFLKWAIRKILILIRYLVQFFQLSQIGPFQGVRFSFWAQIGIRSKIKYDI